MSANDKKGILATICIILIFLSLWGLLWFGGKVNGFAGLVDKAKANSGDLVVARQVSLGNYTESEGDVLHFDNGFVVLNSKNVFANTEDLTLKVFILPELNEKGAPFLCAKDICVSVGRNNVLKKD